MRKPKSRAKEGFASGLTPVDNKERILVFMIFVLAFSLRLFIVTISDNWDSCIPSQRVHAALRLLNHPFSLNYMLFHFHYPLASCFIAAVLRFWHNIEIAPRIPSLIFGSFLIFPFFYYVKLIFNKNVAFFAAFLAAIYSQHVVQSTLSTSDIPFHFFLFVSLFCFFKFKDNPNKNFLFLVSAAISLCLASMLRYEAFIFIPILTLFVYRVKKTLIIIFLPISLIYLMLHSLLSYCQNGSPLNYLIMQSQGVQEYIKCTNANSPIDKIHIWNQLQNLFIILNHSLPRYTAILGSLALFASLAIKKYLPAALMLLLLLLAFVYKIATNTILTDPRYTITLGLLLIPYAALGLDFIINVISRYNRKWRSILVLSFFIYLAYFSIERAIAQRPFLPRPEKNLISWLDTHVTSSDRILIDMASPLDYGEDIAFRSRLNLDQFLAVRHYHKNGKLCIDDTKVLDYLHQQKPRYIILYHSSPDKSLTIVFNFKHKTEERFGCIFNLVYQKDDYWVYEVVSWDQETAFTKH